MKKFNAVFFLALILGCTEEKDNQVVLYPPELEVISLSDSVFFGWVRDVELDTNHVYLIDQGSNKILETNYNFHLKQRYGVSGQGPGEMMSPLNLAVNGDGVVVYDHLNGKFIEFQNLEPFREHKYSGSTGEFALFDSDNVIGYSYGGDELSVFKLNLSNSVKEKLYVERNSLFESNPRVHILKNSDFIVLVFRDNLLSIRILDLQGELIRAYNQEDLLVSLGPWVKSLELENFQNKKEGNIVKNKVMFFDAYLTEKGLYLLIPQIVRGEGKPAPSTIVKYLIDSEGLLTNEEVLVYDKEGDDVFYSIAVSEKQKVVFGYNPSKGSLSKFSFQ
ncbi:hypothetical protein [Roseivirga pacifica]|uniref:hypothetical protein n=1 Tax=Roseivirga pacifica TaxID=1267423 RepID=UPI003BB156EF